MSNVTVQFFTIGQAKHKWSKYYVIKTCRLFFYPHIGVSMTITFTFHILFLIFCCGMAWMDMFNFGNENVCTFFKMQQKQMPL